MAGNIVAIVGRPNVGKSTLFNRLTKARTAIEEKVPGVTRDRLYGISEWRGRNLVVIDTGGLTFNQNEEFSLRIREQVELAMSEADVILFLMDGRDGLTPLDQEIADMLRRSGKSVLPVVNKLDFHGSEENVYGFYSIGFGEPMPLSAAHGRGTGEILDAICDMLPGEVSLDGLYPENAIKIAVIGRPNVGKSSIINKLLGEDRVIVSNLPGTTRDAVDTLFYFEEQPYVLIDTAGMRRKSKVKDSVEYYSVLRSLKAVQRADIGLLVLDAEDGITEQDQRLAGFVEQEGRGLVVAVNKWDLKKGDEEAREKQLQNIARQFNFVPYAPVEFISALTGRRLDKLFPILVKVWQEQHKRIATALLNELLEDALAVNPPPNVKGKRVKIFYGTQPQVKPPTFVFFSNEPDLIHFSYKRYLENRIREAFDFMGTPIRIKFNRRVRRGE